jgi:hypothetical protein
MVYNKGGVTQLLEVYPMEVTKVLTAYLESGERTRKWFNTEKAMSALQSSSKPQLARHLKKLLDNLQV